MSTHKQIENLNQELKTVKKMSDKISGIIQKLKTRYPQITFDSIQLFQAQPQSIALVSVHNLLEKYLEPGTTEVG